MKKPKPVGNDNPITSIRLTPELRAAIDLAAERLRAERPGLVVKRPDAIRTLLTEALFARKIPIAATS